jgi:hypothetical protein
MALKSINWIKIMMFRHKQVKGALLLAISFFTSTAFSFEIGMDIASSHGGDKIIKVVSQDNADITGNTGNADILIGDGIIIGVVARRKVGSIYDVTASIGYKYKSKKFKNGTFSFSTFPTSVGLRANIHKMIALEVGAVAFLNPEMTVTVAAPLSSPSIRISSDPAQYLEISLKIDKKKEITLRYISGLVFTKQLDGVEAKAKGEGDHVSFIARAFF